MSKSIIDKIIEGYYNNKLPYKLPKSKNPEAWKAYKEEDKRICNQFKQDLFKEFDVKDNPKADLCFSKAWEVGHAWGYGEVYNHFQDLVELIK
jgi:hypothetical protein